LLTFCAYWLVPFVFCVYDGTLLGPQSVAWLQQRILDFSMPDTAIDAADKFLSSQTLIMDGSVGYLDDMNHFIFAITLCLGCTLGVAALRNFNRTMDNLQKNGVPATDSMDVSSIYEIYLRKAFRPAVMIACGGLAVLAFYLFIGMYDAPGQQGWWGNSRYGIAGLVFAVIIGAMVFSLLWGGYILTMGSIMLSRIVRLPMSLRPFHQDGCNGLAPLGKQILLLWWVALSGGAAIYVTLRLGYLGIERTPLIRLLAVVGSAMIPAIAILPLYASLKSIQEIQNSSLEHLGPLLNNLLLEANSAVREQNFEVAKGAISRINELKELFEIVKSANVWPFNPKALTIVATANVIQIALTAKELLHLFPM